MLHLTQDGREKAEQKTTLCTHNENKKKKRHNIKISIGLFLGRKKIIIFQGVLFQNTYKSKK